MNAMSRVRPGVALRGAGIAIACLLPGVTRRAEVLATSFVAAWPIDRPGVQLVTLVPEQDAPAWQRAVVPVATSGASWTLVMSLAVLGVRRLRLPTPVGAVLLGAGVAAADTAMIGWSETIKAKAEAARVAAAAEES